jgi:Lipocalin-like domain
VSDASGRLTAADLIGTWLLRRWVLTLEDGLEEMPFGVEPQGVVVYTTDGRMITTIGSRERPAAGKDLSSVDDAARLAAIRTFIAYSGTFTIDGDDVVHHVEMGLDPAWIGTQQRRHVELSDDGRTLILSTDPLLVVGRRGRHRLTWERAAG